MALGHGLQDAQKTMGVIVLALVTYGSVGPDDDIPVLGDLAAASAISLGTYAGGWRIMRTLGRRIIDLDPPQGFAAETIAASVLYFIALVLRRPDLHHPHDHLGDHGGRRHQAALRGALGRGRQDRDRLGDHHPRRRAGRRRVLPGSPALLVGA